MTCNWENKDCCELLSAYLDGEVTAAERKQVENWLATDPRMQQLHRRLLKLHQGWQSLPSPEEINKADVISTQVFKKIKQRSRRRWYVFGGGAIAALLVATISSILSPDNSPIPQIADSEIQPNISEPLQIAIDRPVLPIPPDALLDQ